MILVASRQPRLSGSEIIQWRYTTNIAILKENVKKVAIDDVVNALFKLPSEQIMAVYDFILFLQARHGQMIDESDSWTEEDLIDLRKASLQYAAATSLNDEQELH